MAKAIHAASDILDEFRHQGRFYTRRHIDDLMAYLASLGVTQHEWVFEEGRTTLYDDYPGGFDLLAYAVEAAHRHGIALHAVLKPFEAVPVYAPHTFPQPPGTVWVDLRGILTAVDPFAVEHPQYCLERRPGDADPPGPTTAIRLVKGDAGSTAIEAKHLSIWTSDRLGTWTRYDKPFELRETVEWRPLFPWTRDCRILTLGNLHIPAEQRYVEVRLSDDCPEQDFVNDGEFLIELVGESGRELPVTASPQTVYLRHVREWLGSPIFDHVNRYLKAPGVRDFLAEPGTQAQWDAMRELDIRHQTISLRALHKERRATIARGKNRRLPILHPIHPQVREHWLETVRYFLDRGVDGVDVRFGTHFRCAEPWAYGYNQAVLDRIDGPINAAAVARVNGEACTQLLREIGELVHSRGAQLGVHVLHDFMHRQNDQGKLHSFAEFDWPWKQWVRDLADYVVFRGAMGYREAEARRMVDEVALVAREAAKPFILQCNRRVVKFDGPHPDWQREMQWALSHPDISAYQLYETAGFTRLSDGGEFEGSSDLRQLLATVRGA